MQYFHTRHLEDAARELAAHHERVFIRNKNVLWNPIRLRRAKLADLEPYIVLNPVAFDAQLTEWNHHGGMLIYDRAYRRNEDVAAHHAQLIAECPLSIEDLEAYVDGTRDVAVIYRPPRWDEHRRCVGLLWPPGELCQRYYEIVRAGPTDVALGTLLGLPAGFTCTVDEAVCKDLGLTAAELWRVRNATFRIRDYRMVNAVIPRIEPEEPTLVDVYRFIERECPVFDNKRLIVGSALSKATKNWKVALRDLARCGAIARMPTLFCHLPDVMPPHWFKIDAEHARAAARLEEIIVRVEALPELTTPVSTRSRAPAGQSRSTSSA